MNEYIEGSIIRTAKKAHRCSGVCKSWRPITCTRDICKGDKYVEYIGEVAAFQSGQRYCLPCAEINLKENPMNCKSCGRESLTGEPLCPDCQPVKRLWPTQTYLQRRLDELRKEQSRETND